MLFTAAGFNSTFNLHIDTRDRVKNISRYPKESNAILHTVLCFLNFEAVLSF